MTITKFYQASGDCFGFLWGGAIGGYPARITGADSMEALEAAVRAAIDDKSIDSGFGFERVFGAVMGVTVTYYLEHSDGYTYTRREYGGELVLISNSIPATRRDELRAIMADMTASV